MKSQFLRPKTCTIILTAFLIGSIQGQECYSNTQRLTQCLASISRWKPRALNAAKMTDLKRRDQKICTVMERYKTFSEYCTCGARSVFKNGNDCEEIVKKLKKFVAKPIKKNAVERRINRLAKIVDEINDLCSKNRLK